MKTLLSVLLIGLFSTNGFAADAVTPHACKKPKLLSRAADMEENKRFDRDFKVYKSCIEKYVKEHDGLAVAHHNVAKAAVDEINAFVVKANAK